MDFKQHLYDTVKEWELKIGYQKEAMQLYYPKESLQDLLGAEEGQLASALEKVTEELQSELGKLYISKLEDNRFCIRIPSEGVEYIHTNIATSPFLKAFLEMIVLPNTTLDDIEKLFYQFSSQVNIQKVEESARGFWFQDETIDPYVYYIEQEEFGIQYHRFTRSEYKKNM
ncbi:MAG: DUF3877 family protein [Candidatus Ruminococcus intestinipullorum]|nr:DUF3877 family protein [Candidatus Ruminococcus intestinipullorum]